MFIVSHQFSECKIGAFDEVLTFAGNTQDGFVIHSQTNDNTSALNPSPTIKQEALNRYGLGLLFVFPYGIGATENNTSKYVMVSFIVFGPVSSQPAIILYISSNNVILSYHKLQSRIFCINSVPDLT